MDTQASSWFVEVDDCPKKPVRRRIPKKSTKTFLEALREKYIKVQDVKTQGYVIVFHGRPKTDNDEAELAYLRNVCLCNYNISSAGLESSTLVDLCPNVVDLDLSNNLLESWEEILPVISQLPRLNYLNLARNKIKNNKSYLQEWKKPLPEVQNLVLNGTQMKWGDVLRLAKMLPQLKELHICGNGYIHLPDTTFRTLQGLECLRLNNNRIESWQEIWKLRYLSQLKTLILSGNPLLDLFFNDNDLDPSCACFCHHDDNEAFRDDRSGGDNLKTDVNDINIVISESNQSRNFAEISTQDENGNMSYPEDALIEEWCQKILEEVISELVQERYSALKNQNWSHQEENHRNNVNSNNEGNNNTAKSINTRNQNTKNKIENLKAGSYFFLTSSTEEPNKRSNSESSECECYCNRDDLPDSGFPILESLCVSETNIGKWRHLSALNAFPSLKSLRIKDIKLGSKLSLEDRRKLFIASLPKIQILNGSEVTTSEREKSERHFLRYFLDKKSKPECYQDLERKHGKISPLVDIDIGAGFQEWATLDFIYCGQKVLTEAVRVREPVGKLRLLIAERLCLYASLKCIRMYHKSCGPYHRETDDGEIAFDELFLDSLPMSRFDIMEGDEIHIDADLQVWNSLTSGHLKYICCLQNYFPVKFGKM